VGDMATHPIREYHHPYTAKEGEGHERWV